jgi:hypothetical protein
LTLRRCKEGAATGALKKPENEPATASQTIDRQNFKKQFLCIERFVFIFQMGYLSTLN